MNFNIVNTFNFSLSSSFVNDIGIILIFLGCCGIMINRHNIILSIIGIELIFYGLNFYLITTSLCVKDILGEIFSLFVLTIAAAESALALALMSSYFKIFKNILIHN